MNVRFEGEYRPIADYALLGDAHTAALVARDGSIDWCCLPHFDSPAVFCRLLDARKGGWFRVGPRGSYEATRAYVGATNVLATTFTASGGQARVTDCMPVEPRTSGRGEDVKTTHEIVRLVEGLSGEVEIEVSFRPTFDFARAATELVPVAGGAVASAGTERLTLTCQVPLQAHESGGLVGSVRVRPGDRLFLVGSYTDEGNAHGVAADRFDSDSALQRTLRYWERWSEECTYEGPYEDLVRRSALTLKLLTFEPTGALVAAPTTSLPEAIGGVRNWDYRFTWLRDASLTLYSLLSIGYHNEAMDFFDWLESLCVCCQDGFQIMYTVGGSRELPERVLPHLAGYRGSRPVRIGNAAAGQLQLDVYGEILDAAHLCYERMRPIPSDLWTVLQLLADRAAERWRQPDHGIWEVRSEPQHFLYSKLLCWVAVDRALRLAASSGLPGDVATWRQARDEIRTAILKQGYDTGIGAFTQAFGTSALDASALVIPLVGFLPATDPRVQSTMRRIQRSLTSRGLVYRYLAGDGLPGDEATFALCSFWLVDNLALTGHIDEARELFERVTGYANDVGLLSEEIDPVNGELLGNYPQGFTHLALIRSALNIAKVEAIGAEERVRVPAERERESVKAIKKDEV